jgi:hypothetical protein
MVRRRIYKGMNDYDALTMPPRRTKRLMENEKPIPQI